MTPPDWFLRNMAETPERKTVDIEGCPIETLTWGNLGKRGLLFVHGNGANADWWSPIAPFFSADWRVGAYSFSGAGGSGWRQEYSMDQYGREAVAAAEAMGLFEGPDKPWIVAHSMGAFMAGRGVSTAAGSRFAGLIVVDCGVQPPGRVMPPYKSKPKPGFATLEEGMSRIRLAEGPTGIAPWMSEHIARHSLHQGKDGLWHRAFDPHVGECLGAATGYVGGFDKSLETIGCRVDYLWGDHSPLMPPATVAHNRMLAPPGARFVELTGASHNVMLELPLEFVAALRDLLQ